MAETGPGPFVLATTNLNKAREIREIFAGSGLSVEVLDRPLGLPEVEETEPTLLGNARLKARAVVAATGLAAIAEDTGIEVAALGGAPGVHTARYAGEPANEEANVDKLLTELRGLEGPEARRARFVTVAVVLWPDGREVVAEGTVEGWVAVERRGGGGFGYDPVFVPLEADGRTFGEMAEVSPDAKHALSHRGRAFRALAGALSGGLQPTGDDAPSLTGDNAAAEPTKHRRGFPRTIRHLGEILVVGFLIEYFVLPQIGGTHHVLHVLATVNPFLPVGGFILEALSLVAYFQLTRSLIPKREDPGLATMARIELSTLAVSHCVPGGNFVGASLGYGLLTKAGVEGPDAGVALATQGLGSAVMLNVIFWVSLLASLPLYGLGHGPHVLYLSAGVLGLLLMAAIAGLVVLFNKGDERATALLASLGAKLPFLHAETLPRLFSQLAARVRQLSKDRRQLGVTIFWASANWLLDAGSLLFFVAAFGRWVNPTALLVAYGLANIAGAIPITPGGLAIIEGTLSTILVGFGTPRTIAILGVIGWRLVNFWLPIPVGGATYLSLRVHPPAPNQAGLAARRAVWRARWRWLTELIERPAPERAIDEGLAVIESGADTVPEGPGAAVAEGAPPTPGAPSDALGGEEKGGGAGPAPGATNGMPGHPGTTGEVESGTSGGAAP